MKKMNRFWAIVLALMVCMTAFTAVADEYENGNPPLAPELELASNPTTGYRWFVTCDDEAVVEITEHGFVSDAEGLLGAGGTENFRLDGAEEGYAVITFRYARSWEEDALYTLTCHVFVNEALDVCIFQTSVGGI